MKAAKFKIAITAVGLLICSQIATAQKDNINEQMQKVFNEFDTNNDKNISKKEFLKKAKKTKVPIEELKKRFTAFDTNRNESISFDEYISYITDIKNIR